MTVYLGLDELFEGRQFDKEVIVLREVVFALPTQLPCLGETMAERRLSMVPTTIRPGASLCSGVRRALEPVRAGVAWRVDEKSVKIRGRWAYLYRAVYHEGGWTFA
jgi:transposase-like protein